MRRGTGIALTALLLSLLFHAALLAGMAWGWRPAWVMPAESAVVEARLLVSTPSAPKKALDVPKPVPPAAAPAPRRKAPDESVDEAPGEPAAATPADAQDGQAAAAVDAPVAPPPDDAAAAVDAPVDIPSPPALASLPARIDMRFGVHYGVAAGEQTLVWVSDGERYTLTSVAAATGLAGLFYRGHFVQTSSGRLTPWGLQPEVFWDQRGDKRASAKLDAAAGRVSLTTATGETRHFPYQSGMQDALSLFLQLALIAPSAGDTLRFVVFNGKKVREYGFELLGEAVLDTDIGPLRTLHLRRLADPDGQFEAWLAVDRAYLPVKVRRSDDKGNTMELRVRSISP